jgi:hypothetical protein
MFNQHRCSNSEDPAKVPQERHRNRTSELEIAQRSNTDGLTRLFAPAELDLDDLAEAIRSLLGPISPSEIGTSSRPNPDLLSFPDRVSHVVEATENS